MITAKEFLAWAEKQPASKRTNSDQSSADGHICGCPMIDYVRSLDEHDDAFSWTAGNGRVTVYNGMHQIIARYEFEQYVDKNGEWAFFPTYIGGLFTYGELVTRMRRLLNVEA